MTFIPPKTCAFCDKKDAIVIKRKISNGTFQISPYCPHCKKNAIKPGFSFPHKLFASTDNIPTLDDYSKTSDPCRRCGSRDGTELHHYAPRHIFEDADKWETGYLCRACHSEWHRRIGQ